MARKKIYALQRCHPGDGFQIIRSATAPEAKDYPGHHTCYGPITARAARYLQRWPGAWGWRNPAHLDRMAAQSDAQSMLCQEYACKAT